jgi:hypothetical protein
METCRRRARSANLLSAFHGWEEGGAQRLRLALDMPLGFPNPFLSYALTITLTLTLILTLTLTCFFKAARDSHKLSSPSVSPSGLPLSKTLPARPATTEVLCIHVFMPGDPGFLIKLQYPSSPVPSSSCLLPHSSIPGRAAVERSPVSCTLSLSQALYSMSAGTGDLPYDPAVALSNRLHIYVCVSSVHRQPAASMTRCVERLAESKPLPQPRFPVPDSLAAYKVPLTTRGRRAPPPKHF